jgi:V/A-type H+-transporting ATPase subunit K
VEVSKMSKEKINMDAKVKRKGIGFLVMLFTFTVLFIVMVPFASAQEEPIANAGGDMTVRVNEEFSINGSAQGENPPFMYEWDFDSDDGLWWETGADPDAEGQMGTFTYTEPGTYNVTLRVTDNNDITDRTTLIIEVMAEDELSTVAYLAAVGAGLAIGIAGMGAGIGVGITGATGAGTVAEKPEMFGKSLVFQALPQTQAIYGLLIAIMILMYSGLLGGAGSDIPISVGLVAVGCGLAVGLAGLSAIGQGIAAGSGISATAEDPKMLGKGIVFSVLPETQAIYGLLVAILLLNFSGLLGGDYEAVRNIPTVGLVAIGCGLSIGIAGLSAIGQGIAASGGVGATAADPKMFGKGIVFSVLPETQAIYGFYIRPSHSHSPYGLHWHVRPGLRGLHSCWAHCHRLWPLHWNSGSICNRPGNSSKWGHRSHCRGSKDVRKGYCFLCVTRDPGYLRLARGHSPYGLRRPVRRGYSFP